MDTSIINDYNPLVSILVTSYNEEKYVKETILSVINQTYNNTEIIVVDDHSTDNTWEIIKHLKSEYEFLKIHRNKTNRGRPYTRNKALNLAKGEYIIWQDGDDISFPNRIQKLVNAISQNNRLVAVGGWAEVFSDTTGEFIKILKYETDSRKIRKGMFRKPILLHSTAIFKKSAIIKVGGFNNQYKTAEDFDLIFRLGTIGDFANIKEIVYKYRFSNKSASKSKYYIKVLDWIYIRFSNAFQYPQIYKPTFVDKMFNIALFSYILLISPKNGRSKMIEFMRKIFN